MLRRRSPSAHTRAVVAALAETPGEWQHGYDLLRTLGLKSGTLYPLLMRLESQGFLEAEWQQSSAAGRPPRHAYRLSANGLRLARELAMNDHSPEPPARKATA